MWKRNEVSFPFLFDHVEKTKRNEQIRRAREGNLSEDNSSSWYSSKALLLLSSAAANVVVQLENEFKTIPCRIRFSCVGGVVSSIG